MSVFDREIGPESFIRPVDGMDPSDGFSKQAAKLDHKHQLGIPSETLWTANAKSGTVPATTNIASVAKYWVGERIWIDFELLLTFSGAPVAGGNVIFDLPFPPVDPGSPFIFGSAELSDTGVNGYTGDVFWISGKLCTVSFRTSPQTFWTAASPWAIGNTDKALLRGRYRRNPNI